jgi:hypothetical protein
VSHLSRDIIETRDVNKMVELFGIGSGGGGPEKLCCVLVV